MRRGSGGVEVVRERGHGAHKGENGDRKGKQSVGSITERMHFGVVGGGIKHRKWEFGEQES